MEASADQKPSLRVESGTDGLTDIANRSKKEANQA